MQTGPEGVSLKTRNLLLVYNLPQSPGEAKWEAGIRAKAETLLLNYGLIPYARLGLSEERIKQALKPDEDSDEDRSFLGRVPGISVLLAMVKSHKAESASRLVDYLERTPLKEVVVPFEGHELRIGSVNPSLERDIVQQQEAIARSPFLSTPPICPIGECLIYFTSTAWGADKAHLYVSTDLYPARVVFYPENLREEVEKTVLPGKISQRRRRQVEAILNVASEYFEKRTSPSHKWTGIVNIEAG